MSRAFVRESDGDELDDELEDEASSSLPAGKIYLTKSGYERLKAEALQLLNVERPEVTRVVQWAASNGDRSENADYIYGKRRLREIDRRLRYLTKRLDAATVIDPAQIEDEVVRFSATVTILDEAGAEATYQIVGSDEIDTDKGLISWQSPVAQALMGALAGDEVSVRTPGGTRVLEVLRVAYR